MAKKSKFDKKYATVMREYSKGKLRSGVKKRPVKSAEQARAIAYSEAKKATK